MKKGLSDAEKSKKKQETDPDDSFSFFYTIIGKNKLVKLHGKVFENREGTTYRIKKAEKDASIRVMCEPAIFSDNLVMESLESCFFPIAVQTGLQ